MQFKFQEKFRNRKFRASIFVSTKISFSHHFRMEIFSIKPSVSFPLPPSTSIVSASLQGGDLKSDIGFRGGLNWSRMISEMEKWVRPAGNNFYRNGIHATLFDRNVKARRVINTRSRSFPRFSTKSFKIILKLYRPLRDNLGN